MTPEVIGIDPSLRATGICLPDGTTFTIKTGEAAVGDYRLNLLEKALRYYLRSFPARLAVVETPGDMGGFRSIDAAMAAGMAQGVIRLVLGEFRIPFGKINPTLVKKFATGHGGGSETDKAHMIAAANRHRIAPHVTPHMNLRGEPNCPGCKGERLDPLTDDNQADAWWLREMGLWYLGVRHLDPANDTILNSEIVRRACVADRKGAKWPAANAVRPAPATGHP